MAWWLQCVIVFVVVSLVVVTFNGFRDRLPEKWRLGRPGSQIEYVFPVGSEETHRVLIRYSRYESKMRIGVDEGTVLTKRHLFRIPRHEEFRFSVAGHVVLLARDSRPRKRDGKFCVFTVFVDGQQSYEFSG
jgi:hypothetical protein